MTVRGAWRRTAAALLAGSLALWTAVPAAAQASPSKKELAARIVQLQMPGIEQLAQALVERPAALMVQDAGTALSKRGSAEGPEVAARRIQAAARRYIEETAPIVRGRAVALAPQMFGRQLEADFSEAELTQLLGWLESPVVRKYQQALPGIQDGFMQKLVAESRPLVDPKLFEFEQEIRSALGLPPLAEKGDPKLAPGSASKKK
ncbi:hypothetical protein [Piscinibacter sakaiensis]|uniref:hypothetical protein n=1 Tax=Piscinibacter sakaiensis TaxID=1547922 RepID=UPI003AAC51BF